MKRCRSCGVQADDQGANLRRWSMVCDDCAVESGRAVRVEAERTVEANWFQKQVGYVPHRAPPRRRPPALPLIALMTKP